MDNFQLYKTSPLLGGQMKWDIILESDMDDLFVSDFHISPISNRLPYNKYVDENLLVSPHQDNVKNFYKKIESNFYNNCIDHNLEHNYPTIKMEAGDYIKPYDDTFFMGCQRSQYSLYKKQFEFLVPLWLEDCKGLRFKISLLKNGSYIGGSKIVDITSSLEKHNYHNMFVEYFKNYLKYTNIYNGDGRAINIDLSNKTSQVHGLDVVNGVLSTKDTSYVIYNLLRNELPILEFNNLITELLSSNCIIFKQLFNINLCFNPEDILTEFTTNLVDGRNYTIKVITEVFDGGEWAELEIRDIYTNYDFVPKSNNTYKLDLAKSVENKTPTYKTVKINDDDLNVLNYLKDYNAVDLINKNRVVQAIPYWQVNNNENYIFNLYDGFTDITENGDKTLIYGYGPDITKLYVDEKTSHSNLNDLYYINLITDKLSDYGLNSICNHGYQYLSSKITQGFVNGVYYPKKFYTNIHTDENAVNRISHINVLFIYTSSIPNLSKTDELVSVKRYNDVKFIYKSDFNTIIVLSSTLKNFNFSVFKNILNNVNFSNENAKNSISLLKSYIDTVQYNELISFKKGLVYSLTEGPSIKCMEIDYYSKDQNIYLLRYSGNIKPNFFKPNSSKYNYLFEKITGTYDELVTNTEIYKYIDTDYEPIYPSINFYSFKKNKLNYDCSNNPNNQLIEYKWFNNGSHMVLDTHIKGSIDIIENTKESYLNAVFDFLKQYYGNEELANNVVDLYNITGEFVGNIKDNNKEDYKYNIELTLK